MATKLTAFAPTPREQVITPEGYPFIGIALFLAVTAAALAWFVAAFFLGLITLFVCFFFRNPKRQVPPDHEVIIAPADGRIIAIEESSKNPLGVPATKISTFMSVFNCHVNRVPVNGKVLDVNYHPGRFFVASLDKASESNERNIVRMKDGRERPLAIVQIAGVVARRIVCYLKEGFDVGRGSRLGIIRFGSRVELFLPKDAVKVFVKKGDRVRAGESVIGRWL